MKLGWITLAVMTAVSLGYQAIDHQAARAEEAVAVAHEAVATARREAADWTWPAPAAFGRGPAVAKALRHSAWLWAACDVVQAQARAQSWNWRYYPVRVGG